MRFLAVFVLIGAVLGAGCGDPARSPGESDGRATIRTAPPPLPPQRQPEPGWPAEVVAVPDGFPGAGVSVSQASRRQAHDAWVVAQGTVERLLRDDTKRPRHQRFVARVGPDQTVMIAHNIDLAPRVPLKRGDTIAFRGKYVWNAQGGIVHWTHRDRRDANDGGWIVWKGQNFR